MWQVCILSLTSLPSWNKTIFYQLLLGQNTRPARITVAMQMKAKNWGVCNCCFILVFSSVFQHKILGNGKRSLAFIWPRIVSFHLSLSCILINWKPSVTMYMEKEKTTVWNTVENRTWKLNCGSKTEGAEGFKILNVLWERKEGAIQEAQEQGKILDQPKSQEKTFRAHLGKKRPRFVYLTTYISSFFPEYKPSQNNLLYSTGNSAQCYIAAWTGGEFGGEWIQVCVRLSPFAIYLKLPQLLTIINHLYANIK